MPSIKGQTDRGDHSRNGLMQTLAHHDAEIRTLGGRMGGVETGLRTLQGEVHTGFSLLSQKLDRVDARPTLDLHKAVGTVLALAVLFSMVVGGIIWVTQNQFSGIVAEQKALNSSLSQRTDKNEAIIEKLAERVGWTPKVDGKR